METTLLAFLPSGTEWIVVVFVIILLFGGRKIPELMRGIGKGIREFNAAKDNLKQELEEGMNEPRKKEEATETK